MTIRKLKVSELDFLADMLFEAIFIPKGHAPLPKEIILDKSLSRYIDDWGKDKFDFVLVKDVDNQPVGAIWGRLLKGENKGFGYVDDRTPELSMAVKQDYRNQGIGTELIEAIASEYQNIGVQYLSQSVDKANNASKLYKRLGYDIVEETETSWTMKKRIE
jgi:ribosomal protein S18 acetylase RimI-like enzyme